MWFKIECNFESYKTILSISSYFRIEKLIAKVSIREHKQFSDSGITLRANARNFKGDYALAAVADSIINNNRQGDLFEMKVTELNTDRTYGRIFANFPNKVGLKNDTQIIYHILQISV